jgi:DNA-binding transcriptional LysR family regulator
MDFDRLRYLAALARTGSMRSAAAALGVTPGAVSKGIARLEEESGVALLVPSGRGVVLTDEGAWLARRAEHLVDEYASLGADLSSRRDREPELCIAAYDVFATWFPGVLSRTYLPGVPLSVRERWPGEVEAAVANTISDVGITYLPVALDGVEHVEVARVELVVATRAKVFDATRFDALPFAVTSHPISGAVGQYGPLDGWPADAPPRDARFRASSLEARLDLCRQGVAVTVVPAFVVALHNRRARAADRLVTIAIPRRIGVLRRRVFVVRRRALTGARAAQVDVVASAVRALCDVTE